MVLFPKSLSNLTFNELYDTHKDLVFNLCLNYLHNQEDAEDATQDIFVKIHQKLASFQRQSNLKTWVYRIGVNHCLDILKSRKRQKRFAFLTDLFFPNSSELRHDTPTFDHPGILLERKELMEKLFQQINQLPSKQKTALILTKLEQMSVKEAAEIMNQSPKSVESLLQRAKRNLGKSWRMKI